MMTIPQVKNSFKSIDRPVENGHEEKADGEAVSDKEACFISEGGEGGDRGEWFRKKI